MRTIGAALLATALVMSSAFAATKVPAPLPAGKPAGAKQAALLGPRALLVLLGTGIVIGGFALTVIGNSDGITSPATTSTSGLP